MLKPQDIVVALQLLQAQGLTQDQLAAQVGLSQPEISNVLRRLAASRLIIQASRSVIVPHLIEVCIHGVKYFFPPVLGNRKGGIPTVALAAPLKGRVAGEDLELVWPTARGSARANSLQPLHPCVVHAAQQDPSIYELLVLLDGLRVGGARVSEVARELFIQRVEERRKTSASG